MDIKDIRSSLQMKNFYFSKFSFVRDKVIKNGELNADIKKNIIPIGKHEYKRRVNNKYKYGCDNVSIY